MYISNKLAVNAFALQVIIHFTSFKISFIQTFTALDLQKHTLHLTLNFTILRVFFFLKIKVRFQFRNKYSFGKIQLLFADIISRMKMCISHCFILFLQMATLLNTFWLLSLSYSVFSCYSNYSNIILQPPLWCYNSATNRMLRNDDVLL